MGRLTAINSVVFPSGYADFIVRESRRCSDRIFRSRHCSPFTSFDAVTSLACCRFQQRELGAGHAGYRYRSLLRANSRRTFLRWAIALARKVSRADYRSGCRRGGGCSFTNGRQKLVVRLRQRAELSTGGTRISTLGGRQPTRRLAAHADRNKSLTRSHIISAMRTRGMIVLKCAEKL